jgi:hypothetical protein
MPNYANTVAQIRSLLSRATMTLDDRLEALAREYANACAAANDRLTRCHEFLNKGLRCEAVNHAKTSPDLLDTLTVLEFPERNQWDEVTAAYKLPVAARANPHAAAALNQAFADQAPLASLQSRLRRLALEQGPVGERLTILHELMRLDPQNPVWSESIGDFESVRLKELERAVSEACRKSDVAVLHELDRELSAGWTVHVPPAVLREKIRAALQQVAAVQRRNELAVLAREAVDAFRSRQVAQIDETLSRWDVLVQAADGIIPRATAAKMQPILAWRDKQRKQQAEENAFQAALADLQSALDRESAPTVLRLKLSQIEKLNRPVPLPLRRRCEAAIWTFDEARTRNLRRLAMAGAAAGVFVFVLICWHVASQRWEQAFHEKIETFAYHLRQGEIAEADLFYQSLVNTESSEALQRQEVVKHKLHLDALKQAEAERLSKFAQLLSEIENDRTTAETAASAVAARKLAKTHGERAAVDRASTARQDRLHAEQQRRDRAYEDEYRRVGKLLKDAEKEGEGAAFEAKLREVEDGVARLSSLAGNLSPAVVPTHPAFLKQADALRKKAERLAQTDARFAQMAQAFEAKDFDLDSYCRALEALAATTANEQLSRDLKQASQFQAYWKSIHDWNRTLAMKIPPSRPGFTAFLDMPARHPERNRIEDEYRFRYFDEKALFGQISETLHDPLFCDLCKVKRHEDAEAAPKKEFYTSNHLWNEDVVDNAKLDALPKLAQVRLIQDYGYDPARGTTDNKKTLVFTDSRVSAKQSQVADAAIKMLDSADSLAPEEAVLKVAKLVQDANEIDAIAQLQVLKKIVGSACSASSSLRIAFGEHTKVFDSLTADLAVPWMDPEDARARSMLPKAKEDSKRLPSITSVQARLRAVFEAHDRELAKTAALPVGFLVRSGRELQVQPRPRLRGEYQLAVVQKQTDGTVEWVEIGDLRERASIDPTLTGIPQGSLVFARVKR